MQFDSGPLRFRTMKLNAGQSVPSHQHNFPHPTLVVRGTVRLDMPGETVTLCADDPDECKRVHLVPAGIEHTIVAVTAAEIFCIYPHRDEAGEIVPASVGFERGYW